MYRTQAYPIVINLFRKFVDNSFVKQIGEQFVIHFLAHACLVIMQRSGLRFLGVSVRLI